MRSLIHFLAKASQLNSRNSSGGGRTLRNQKLTATLMSPDEADASECTSWCQKAGSSSVSPSRSVHTCGDARGSSGWRLKSGWETLTEEPKTTLRRASAEEGGTRLKLLGHW